jgi:pimeloyl-ACP methyl ester carboxylesterase
MAPDTMMEKPLPPPMRRLDYRANENSRAETLLVLMAGAGDDHQAFAANGVIGAAREGAFAADIVTVDAHVDYFTDLTVRERLHHEVVDPAHAQGYARVWLGGISLGGFAALLYAQKYAEHIAGLALVAPYLGNRGTLAEIESAGGLDAWQPGELGDHDERKVWLMLKRYAVAQSWPLPIHLLYGDQDRFARFHALLATRLDPRHVTVMPGAHDWSVWTPLWAHFFKLNAAQFRSGGNKRSAR